MGDLKIRDAIPGDALALLDIYRPFVTDTAVSFELEPPTLAEFEARIASAQSKWAWLVAERDGRVIAWASLNRFNPRPAYDHVADLSIYVQREWRGQGVGRRLLEALVARASELGYHKIVLAAFPWNEAGMRAYARAGFREVGIYREQGRLEQQGLGLAQHAPPGRMRRLGAQAQVGQRGLREDRDG